MIDSKKLELILQEIIRRVNRADRRIRELEQRTQTLETRVNTIEDSLFKQNKEIKKKIIDIEVNMKSTTESIMKLEQILSRITDQIKEFARKKEVKELEEMFNLLNPIKSEFVTKDEVKRMIKDAMEEIS